MHVQYACRAKARRGDGFLRRAHPYGDRGEDLAAFRHGEDAHKNGIDRIKEGARMTNEEHLALMDRLTGMALGEVSGEEAAPMREHLETCDTCRREYREVSEGMVVLAISATGPAAPARSRERLLRAAQVWDEPQ